MFEIINFQLLLIHRTPVTGGSISPKVFSQNNSAILGTFGGMGTDRNSAKNCEIALYIFGEIDKFADIGPSVMIATSMIYSLFKRNKLTVLKELDVMTPPVAGNSAINLITRNKFIFGL